jgi:hypothetical protein
MDDSSRNLYFLTETSIVRSFTPLRMTGPLSDGIRVKPFAKMGRCG